MRYSINELQAGDVVMPLRNERRGKAAICAGFMYNVVRIQLIQCKVRGLTDEIGVLLSQKETQWTDWQGKPGLWPIEFFKITYRPSPDLIEKLLKKINKK